VAVATQLWAYPDVARQTKTSCITCHANVAGGAGLSAAGTAFKADGKAPAASTAKAAEYVGVNKCKMCHMKQHKAWAETPHAKAWAGLKNADAKKAAEMAAAFKVELKGAPTATDDCVSCHVTGFQLGSLHVTAPMAEKKKFIAKATEKMCKQCHVPAASPDFVFADYAKRGVHAVAAAAK